MMIQIMILQTVMKRKRKPLGPGDLIKAMTSHYHGTLSALEMDEIILDGK